MTRHATLLLLILGLLSFGMCATQQPTPSLEQLAKERSPKKLVRAYTAAILQGKADKIAEAYDLSTEGGKASALAVQTLTKIVAAARNLGQKTRQMFGERGVQLAERILKAKLGYPNYEEHVRKLLDQVEIYKGKDERKAVALVPIYKQRYVPLERKRGRWFFAASEKGQGAEQATAMAELFAVASQDTINKLKEATRLVGSSKTLAEFEESLKKLVADKSSRSPRETAGWTTRRITMEIQADPQLPRAVIANHGHIKKLVGKCAKVDVVYLYRVRNGRIAEVSNVELQNKQVWFPVLGWNPVNSMVYATLLPLGFSNEMQTIPGQTISGFVKGNLSYQITLVWKLRWVIAIDTGNKGSGFVIRGPEQQIGTLTFTDTVNAGS